jgi:hypothetical protein
MRDDHTLTALWDVRYSRHSLFGYGYPTCTFWEPLLQATQCAVSTRLEVGSAPKNFWVKVVSPSNAPIVPDLFFLTGRLETKLSLYEKKLFWFFNSFLSPLRAMGPG